jgi:hypothetical protein
LGWNATLLILTDALHQIKEDKEFGKKVHDAVLHFGLKNEPVDINCNGHCNAATVIDHHHADTSSLIAIGGNYGTVILQYCGGYSHHTDQAKLNILEEFARQMGYKIVKDKK